MVLFSLCHFHVGRLCESLSSHLFRVYFVLRALKKLALEFSVDLDVSGIHKSLISG